GIRAFHVTGVQTCALPISEARQYLGLLGVDEADEAALLGAMAGIVDEEPVTGSPFDGQESCDTAAALWAALAGRDQPLLPGTNRSEERRVRKECMDKRCDW